LLFSDPTSGFLGKENRRLAPTSAGLAEYLGSNPPAGRDRAEGQAQVLIFV